MESINCFLGAASSLCSGFAAAYSEKRPKVSDGAVTTFGTSLDCCNDIAGLTKAVSKKVSNDRGNKMSIKPGNNHTGC